MVDPALVFRNVRVWPGIMAAQTCTQPIVVASYGISPRGELLQKVIKHALFPTPTPSLHSAALFPSKDGQ